MRAVAGCWVACGPTAQPQASRSTGSTSRRGSSASSLARPPALLILQHQLEQQVDALGLRPALQFVPAGATASGCGAPPTPAVLLARSSWPVSQSFSQHSAHPAQQQHWQQQHEPLNNPLLPSGPYAAVATGEASSSSSSSTSSGSGATSSGSRPSSSSSSSSAQSGSGSRFGVQLNEPPPRQQQEPDKDFFANVGDAIRTLREDYPLLFVKDLNYSIYREDLVFKDPNLTFQGLKTYKAIFWGLRFHGRLLLKAAHVQVLRIWQPEETVIKLRWQINAQPRLWWEAAGTFDGISIYRLDRHGRVYQHEVTDVQLRDPPITNPLLYGLNFILSPRPQVQQVPCPGSWYVDGEEELLPDFLPAASPVLLPASISHD